MAISKQEYADFRKLVRKANRRLERASEGQRKAMEYYFRKYHMRETAEGEKRFSGTKPETAGELRLRTAELEDFIRAETSYRAGWKALKAANVAKANIKLTNEKGYTFTDRELATIMEEYGDTKGEKHEGFYAALANVQAAKNERELKRRRLERRHQKGTISDEKYNAKMAELSAPFTEDELKAEMYTRLTEQQITERLLKSREALRRDVQRSRRKK